jgi:hypothetical protein
MDVSEKPIRAPANYADGEQRHGSLEDLAYWGCGPGWPTRDECGACGNREGNLEIYESWSVSSHSGDAFECHELRCGACGKYSAYVIES